MIDRFLLAAVKPLIRATASRPGFALAACCLALLYPIFNLTRIETNNSLEIWFVEEDPALQSYHEFQNTFGTDDIILVVYQRPPESDARTLETTLTNELLLLQGVQSVSSPSSSPYRKRHLSSDGSHGAMVIELAGTLEPDDDRVEMMSDIERTLDRVFTDSRVTFATAGVSVILNAMNRVSAEDSRRFLLLASLVTLGILAVGLRRLSLIAGAIAAVAVCTAATIGLYVTAGKALNAITSVLAPLALVIGVAGALHIGHHYQRFCPRADKRLAVVEGVESAAVPVVLATLTTAAGFASLCFSRLVVIRDLGVFAAVGIALSAPLTIVVTTAVYSLLPAPRARSTESVPFMRTLWMWILRRRMWILVLSTIVFVTASLGVLRMKVDTYSIELLRADHPVRRDSDYIETNFGFYTPLEIVAKGSPGFWEEPQNLIAVRNFENLLSNHDLIDSTLSVATMLPGLERLSGPRQTRLVLRRLIPEEIRTRFLDEDNSTIRISARVKMMSAANFRQIMNYVQNLDWPIAGAKLSVSGFMPLYVRMIEYVTATQISSFVLSFVVVFAILSVFAGSLKIGVSAVLVNLFPLGLALGIIGWSGMRLDVGTVITAAIAVGIVVDDTIHFLHQHRNSGTGIGRTIETVGPAIVQTSIALCLGFLVLTISRVTSMARFGAICSATIVAALHGDLVLLPALIGE